MRREVVSSVIAQHVEDAAILHAIRSALASAPHVKLHHLRRFDDRIAAHCDGLRIAGEGAWPLCKMALELLSPGAIFTATLQAVQSKSLERLDRLLALAQSAPDAACGLRAAFGWLEPDELRGVVAALLASDSPGAPRRRRSRAPRRAIVRWPGTSRGWAAGRWVQIFPIR